MNPLVHDEKGRFIPGNRAGGGRKPKQVEREYIDALRSVCTPDSLKEYVQRAMKLAEEIRSPKAMINAATFVAEYTIGKPKQQIEVTSGADLLALLEQDDTPLIPVDAEVEAKRLE